MVYNVEYRDFFKVIDYMINVNSMIIGYLILDVRK